MNDKYKFCDQLEALWVSYPHQRFLQLLYNVLMKEFDTANLNDGKLYNLTDEKLYEVLKRTKLC